MDNGTALQLSKLDLDWEWEYIKTADWDCAQITYSTLDYYRTT